MEMDSIKFKKTPKEGVHQKTKSSNKEGGETDALCSLQSGEIFIENPVVYGH